MPQISNTAMSQKNLDLRIDDQYRLIQRLGSGGFGVVYEGINIKTSQHVAIKLEDGRSLFYKSIQNEVRIYRELAGGVGIPQLYWSGTECDYEVMVFELLGPSLEDLFNYCNQLFSLRTVLLLADQLIRRFQYIHSRGFVHRDVKPENFLMGCGIQGDTVYVTDLSLADNFSERVQGFQSDCQEQKHVLIGTDRYASIRAHCSLKQTPADDMEALGYVLIYFLQGKLPWEGLQTSDLLERQRAIMQIKQSTPLTELCKDLPDEFMQYFIHIRSSRDDDQGVNYKYLLRTFRNLFSKHNFKYNNVYDWTVLKYMEIERLQKEGSSPS